MTIVLHNRKILRDRRRALRRNDTEAEAALWERLRDRRLGGMKFSRQYGIGPYILDFFCFQTRLAVELDGAHHAERCQAEYDIERSAYLSGAGIKVFRFRNDEVLTDIDRVLSKIKGTPL